MSVEAFPKSRRLSGSIQFKSFFENPKVYRSKYFQAYWKENSKSYSRLGITIKGRTTSVWRSRLKRTVREWFRLHYQKLTVKSDIHTDLNIVLKLPLSKMDQVFITGLKKDLLHWKK